jgi:hypothetical protein
MPSITASQSPLIATLNYCKEKCVTKASQNWKHNVQLMNQYNVSRTIMGQTPPKSLVMAKRLAAPRTCAIRGGMWPWLIWKQSSNN